MVRSFSYMRHICLFYVAWACDSCVLQRTRPFARAWIEFIQQWENGKRSHFVPSKMLFLQWVRLTVQRTRTRFYCMDLCNSRKCLSKQFHAKSQPINPSVLFTILPLCIQWARTFFVLSTFFGALVSYEHWTHIPLKNIHPQISSRNYCERGRICVLVSCDRNI